MSWNSSVAVCSFRVMPRNLLASSRWMLQFSRIFNKNLELRRLTEPFHGTADRKHLGHGEARVRDLQPLQLSRLRFFTRHEINHQGLLNMSRLLDLGA